MDAQNQPTRRLLLRRIYPISEKTFQITLWGNQADARSLVNYMKQARVQKAAGAAGPRYDVKKENGQLYFVANELGKDALRRARGILFKLSPKVSVTWLTVRHEKTGAMFDVRSYPDDYFDRFLSHPRRFTFVQFNQVIAGCLRMLNNAEQLARLALRNESSRIAMVLISSAFEELGKAALLIRSHALSLKSKLSVVVIEGFHDHDLKLDLIMDEILGSFKQIPKVPQGELKGISEMRTVGKDVFMKESGMIDRLKRSFPIIGSKDKWPLLLSRPTVNHLLNSLAEYGSLERERSVYVDYNPGIPDWREPETQFDIQDCQIAGRLVLWIVNEYRPILESLSKLPQGVNKLGDLLNA